MNKYEEQHLALLFAELRASNQRYSWLSFAAWLATVAVILYLIDVCIDGEVDTLAIVAAYALVLSFGANVVSFIVTKVSIINADRRHREWHRVNPDECSPYPEDEVD